MIFIWQAFLLFYIFVLMVGKRLLLVIFTFLGMNLYSQSPDSIAVEESPSLNLTKPILTDRISFIPNKRSVNKSLIWNWECMGPNRQPLEFNPGGRALPQYALNRGNGTGRINYIIQHPKKHDVLWACSPTGGAWISRDHGETWTIAGTDKLPISGVSSVAPDAKKTDRWWIATGDGDDYFQYSDGVWMTFNGGKTYVQMNGKSDKRLPYGNLEDIKGQICEVVSNPKRSRQLLVAGNRGLYMTMEGFNSDWVEWERLLEGYFYDVLIINKRRRSKDVIIAAGDRLAWSDDGGKSWKNASMPPWKPIEEFPFLRMNVLEKDSKNLIMYVAVTCAISANQTGSGEAALFTYDFKKDEWTFVSSLKKTAGNMLTSRARAIAVNPLDNQNLICGNVQPLYRSVDGGASFIKVEKNQMHDDCHHIVYSKKDNRIWATHDGGVSVSSDNGITWKASDVGIGAANVFGLATSQTTKPHFLYGGYDTGGNLFRDSIWHHVSWGDGFETIIHPLDPNIMFSTMQNGNIQRSVVGTSFDTGKNPTGAKTEWHTWIRMHPVNNNIVFCSGAKLQRSTNMGDSWSSIFDAPKMDAALYNVYRFYLSEDYPGVMYAYVLDTTRIHPQIWRSFNITTENPDDIQWQKVADIPVEGWIMGIQVDSSDPNKFFLLYNRNEEAGKFWYFDGTKYIDQSSNLGFGKCEALVLQKGPEKRIYIGSNYGVFTKRESETQWTLLSGLPGTQIKSIAINYVARKLVVGTYGRGIWWGDLLTR